MKKFILFFLLLSAISLRGQTDPATAPLLWHRADSAALGDGAWRNTVSDGHHGLPAGGVFAMPDSLLNFNPAFWMAGGESFVTPVLPLASPRVTAIVVYQTSIEDDEMGLWEIRNPQAGNSAGLSTQRILGTRGGIRYGNANQTRTIINTLSQTWRKERDSVPSAQLAIAGFDTLAFEGVLGEFLLFDKELDNKEIVGWISYLAVKYGVTLFRTNYVDSEDSVIWNYTDYPDFSHSIAGIGRDDARGLSQKQSCLLDNRIIVGLGGLAMDNASNGSPIDDREFLLWGFDSTGLSFQEIVYGEMAEDYSIYGNGLLQRTGTEITESPAFMVVDGSEWGDNPWGCFLLIDRSGNENFDFSTCEWIFPAFVDSLNRIHYRNIFWDTDMNGVDRFCFAYMEPDSLPGTPRSAEGGGTGDGGTGGGGTQESGMRNAKSEKQENGNRYKLYPNPTSGDFHLEIEYQEATSVMVKIYNSAGLLIEEKNAKRGFHHDIEGYLPVSGHYVIEVRSDTETRSFKLVVN